MSASTREEIVEAFTALDAAMDRLCELTFDTFTTPERLRALERLERVVRRARAPQHTLINDLGAQATKEELGGTLRVCAGRPAAHHQTRRRPPHRRSRRPGTTPRADRGAVGAAAGGHRGRPA